MNNILVEKNLEFEKSAPGEKSRAIQHSDVLIKNELKQIGSSEGKPNSEHKWRDSI
jgi:hypothetical protein